jgi:hypothetical protein
MNIQEYYSNLIKKNLASHQSYSNYNNHDYS